MIDLSTLKRGKESSPPRIVLYGPSMCGKSTFASLAPDPIFIDAEGGSGELEVFRVRKDELPNFQAVISAIEALYTQDHSYKTVVLDTADWIEPLIFDQVAREHGKKTIEDIGYGAGYVSAVNLWKQLLSGLTALRDEKGMIVIIICHDMVKRYDNPMTESYDRYQLKLHAKSAAIITEWCDVLLFASQEIFVDKKQEGFKKVTKAKTNGNVVLHTVESPAFLAGNRYGLPPVIEDFTWEAFTNAMTKGSN